MVSARVQARKRARGNNNILARARPCRACALLVVPAFAVSFATLAFGPHVGERQESEGTEDPRIAYDPLSQRYYMMYTAVGNTSKPVQLSLASTRDPTQASGWTLHGPVFPTAPSGSKSGAILVRQSPPHYLFWGAGTIRYALSDDLIHWTYNESAVLLAPRPGMFDSFLVESGPPPLRLSDGNYLFLHNSANQSLAYHVGYVIVDGNDPTRILARSSTPLMSPTEPWMIGDGTDALCNVPNVVFLEAAHPTGTPDEFRVYFGGADSVVGTAVVRVTV